MSDLQRSAKDLIKNAKPQRRSARINLAGHLVTKFQALEAELAELQQQERGRTQRLMDASPLVAKAEAIDAVRDEMAQHWLDLVLEQQEWSDWRRFKAEHPAREDVPEDQYLGVSIDALVTDFLPVCVVEPALDAEDWAGIHRKAAPGDLKDLAALAFRMHEQAFDVPKSQLASLVRQRTSESSEQRERGGSANDG